MSIQFSTGTLLFVILSSGWVSMWYTAQPAVAQQAAQTQSAAQSAKEPAEEKSNYTPEQQQQLDRANELLTQVSKLNDQRKYRDAIPLGIEALKLRESVLPADNPKIAAACSWLGLLYWNACDYGKAEPFYRQACTIYKEALGEKNPEYAGCLNSLGLLYKTMGDFAKAEPLYLQSLVIRKEVLGEKNPEYATSLNNLAVMYCTSGDYAKAEPLYQQALAIRKEVLGEQHPDYASSLNNLATLYYSMGDYVKAEPFLRQALSIRKQVVGEKSPDYANSLNSLAELYQEMGDYTRAEPLLRQALAIRKEAQGEHHPEYALCLNNLAMLYYYMDAYSKAEPLFKQALAIRKEVLGEKHTVYAQNLNNLAVLYVSMGDYARAEPLFKQALAIRRDAIGERHPFYAADLRNLGLLYQHMGEYTKAESLMRQALTIYKEVLGERHPDYAFSLNRLALLYVSLGKYAEAESLSHKALEIAQQQLDLTAVVQSERQQLRMAEMVRGRLDNYLTVTRGAAVPAEQVYAEVLAWKGSVSARQQAMRQLRSQQHDPKVTALYNQLAETSRQLDSLSRAAPKPEQAEKYRQKLVDLNESLETLQQQLAAANADYRRQLEQQKRTPSNLRSALPADTALVDLLEYSHYQPPNEKGQKETWQRRLAAFVVRPQQPIQWIELGPTKPIADLVDRWRQKYSPTDGSELRRLVWQPLEDKLAGTTTVLVSPDGALDRFPLAALPGKKEGTYLIEDVAIATAAIPRLLPELLAATSSLSKDNKDSAQPSLLTVGEVDFKAALVPQASSVELAMRAPLSRDGGGWMFLPLDGTRAEIVAINDSFEQRFPDGQHQSLRKAQATKQAVCEAMSHYSYVHLATHGFFAPPELKSALASTSGDQGSEFKSDLRAGSLDVTGYHPDLLCGLALAGANQQAELGQDDGILTALAVEELDLSHVQLATLSACETGLGRTAGGEGVLGLQRAFQLAGAKSTVTTLWKIPDKASQLLMTDFYANLWDQDKHLSKLEALRQAQLKMLREGANRGLEFFDEKSANEGRLPPFYWAAFELSGDWR
ncbi:MAG TPA: tetratricopeptide repeat protein [Pirellulales bacterium]